MCTEYFKGGLYGKINKKTNRCLKLRQKLHCITRLPTDSQRNWKSPKYFITSNYSCHLANLEAKGFIKKDGSKNRAIELLVKNEFDKENDLVSEVPLLGKTAAGSPIEAIEVPDEYFPLPTYLLPKGKEVFTLEVDGTSMINAGIYDGDIIIVERQNTARNGEIVVAMTDENTVTLKTFYKENGHIRLQPENDTMSPIILDNVTILGKAIGLYRKL